MKQIEFNISNIIFIINKSIMKISSIAFLTSIIFISYSYTIEEAYESRAVLQLSEKEQAQASPLGSLGGLASMTGINLSSGSDFKISLAIERIKSRDFLSNLIEDKELLKNTFSINEDLDVNKILIKAHNKYIQDMLYLKQDRDSGFLNISITHHNPEIAKSFLELIVTELNDISRKKDLEESNNSINYFNEEISRTTNKEMRLSLNKLIELQLQRKMLANVRKDYLVQYIDSPFLPIYRSKPSRTSYAITGFLLGLFLASFFYIVSSRIEQD
jgi:LPS O-antigen subunit length determinant protein (WzzB/FepE family)